MQELIDKIYGVEDDVVTKASKRFIIPKLPCKNMEDME